MLERLTPEEQRVMLELLLHIARADGKVEDVEQEILENYASLVEVDFHSLAGNLAPEVLIPQVPSAVSRAIILQELLRLSHLDGILSKDEHSAISEVAQLMGFPIEVVHRLDEWVLDGIRWVWRGEDLLDEIEAQYGA